MARSVIAQGKRNAKRKAEPEADSDSSQHELEDGILYKDIREKRQKLTGGAPLKELRRRFAAPTVVRAQPFDWRLATDSM